MTNAVLAILLLAAPDTEATAQSHNAAGMAHYKEQDYEAALQEFEAAMRLDPKHALAAYNRACMQALLVPTSGACSLPGVWESLEAAIALDPNAAKKAAKDKDFTAVREQLRFVQLTGGRLTDPVTVERILIATRYWQNEGQGVYHGPALEFREDDFTYAESGLPDSERRSGRYEITKKGQIILHYENGTVEKGWLLPKKNGLKMNHVFFPAGRPCGA